MKAFVIETDKLAENIKTVKELAGDVKLYAVLKGQAYGMGLAETARALAAQGIVSFAVCEPDDVFTLRGAGFADEEVLVLTQVCDEELTARLLEQNAVFTVGSRACAEQLNRMAAGGRARAHIKLDTGMGRFGFSPAEREDIIKLYSEFPNISFEGMFTHLHSAWSNAKASARQVAILTATAAAVKNAGFEAGILHAANSPAFLKMPFARLDAARVGSVFTGRVAGCGNTLKRVGHIEAGILTVRRLPKGATVGYGGMRLKRDTLIAVVPVGYADGLGLTRSARFSSLREFLAFVKENFLSFLGKRPVFSTINGKRARVVGKIGMCDCMLDVTGIECKPGDIAHIDASPIFCGNLMLREYR